MWLYDDKKFQIEDRDKAIGFVYEIRDRTNNIRYIGKKNFFSTRRLQHRESSRRVLRYQVFFVLATLLLQGILFQGKVSLHHLASNNHSY